MHPDITWYTPEGGNGNLLRGAHENDIDVAEIWADLNSAGGVIGWNCKLLEPFRADGLPYMGSTDPDQSHAEISAGVAYRASRTALFELAKKSQEDQ